ncbi:hypothetical protein ACFFWC_25570 [Plantactinospora siamensis]|uniref:Uncharacterized protein n=1 Tax=Plantactinospora siamensis TaxID=555372 RepID=A0ABV6NXD1_9ACTN
MIAQPYPLYYGRLDGDQRLVGRILGWQGSVEQPGATVAVDGAGVASSAGNDAPLRPVVLFANPDGTAAAVRPAELCGDGPCWVRDSEDGLTAAFELHEKLTRIQDLTG